MENAFLKSSFNDINMEVEMMEETKCIMPITSTPKKRKMQKFSSKFYLKWVRQLHDLRMELLGNVSCMPEILSGCLPHSGERERFKEEEFDNNQLPINENDLLTDCTDVMNQSLIADM